MSVWFNRKEQGTATFQTVVERSNGRLNAFFDEDLSLHKLQVYVNGDDPAIFDLTFLYNAWINLVVVHKSTRRYEFGLYLATGE